MSLRFLLDTLRRSPEYERCLAALEGDRAPVWIEGLAGVAKTCLAAAFSHHLKRTLLLVTANEETAETAVADLTAFGFAAGEVGLYPSTGADLDAFLPEGQVLASSVTPERKAAARTRLAVLQGLMEGSLRAVVAPIDAVLLETLGPLAGHRIALRQGQSIDLTETARRLSDSGYERVPLVELHGQFAVRGGLLDVWPSTSGAPVRVELFGDEIESLREFDPVSQGSAREILEAELFPAVETLGDPAALRSASTLLEHLPAGSLLVLDDPNHLRTRWLESAERERQKEELARNAGRLSGTARSIDLEEFLRRAAGFRLAVLTLLAQSIPWMRRSLEQCERGSINSGAVDPVHGDLPELAGRIRSWLGVGSRVVVGSDQPHRIAELLAEHQVPASCLEGPGEEAPPTETDRRVDTVHARLSSGFRLPGIRLVVLSDAEIFETNRRRPRTRSRPSRFKEGRPIISLLELKEGDLVVHVTHGIGRYRGLVRRSVQGVDREFLRIDYQDPDRLFVPSDQLDRVQKYIGADGQAPTIHRLGGNEWARTKTRVQAKVREMARELLELYARRSAAPGYAFSPDTVWQAELEAAFPYRETRDQLEAIADTKRDMEQPCPMDRLICGDVGYGKTEVAIRAAFKAVTDGKQVAVLVPTTVLAQQHFNTFSERLAAFPIRLELLSRFRSRTEVKRALQGLDDGVVDIVIGTHRVLSKDVRFRELGLLIIDEEHRFGVAHKERLKQLRQTVDVLTLTATPIPRTLNMSLSGIRDMSVMEEPPEGRLAVRTYCLEADDAIVREAMLRELDRGGQIYYVHNRVESIYREADRLHRLVPQARIRVGHGQMKESELEDVMLSFYEGEFDILVCTTIIESGLDIPNVNTILVNDSDHFGLAQLHQLRGRVGRSSRQAYCYLLTRPFKELTETAEKRLAAIREFTDLGAGFNIAMRDMEIRGAGNLLGAEQHGNMVSVGFDLFCQMIEDAVRELKGETLEEVLLPGVSLPLPALIPAEYLPTEGLRIAFYRKIAACRTAEEVARVQAEMEDRFGDPPRSVWNMLAVMRLRIDCIPAGVARIETDRSSVVFWMARRIDRDEARELHRHNRRLQFLPDRLILFFDEGENPLRPVESLVRVLRRQAGSGAAAAVQRQLLAATTAETLGRA